MEKLQQFYNSLDNPLNISELDRMREINKKLQEFNEDKERIEEKKKREKEYEERVRQKMEDQRIRNEKCKKFENEEYRQEKWIENKYVCEELVNNENSYCNNLKDVLEKFKKPLERVKDTKNEIFSAVQINFIFQYIPDIYGLSSKLCDELDEAYRRYDNEGPIPVAEVFLNHLSEWQFYIKYIENYCNAMGIFENLKDEQIQIFNRFMEYCNGSDKYNFQYLKDKLKEIIRRFSKYEELFKRIVENSDPRNSDDYDLLETVEIFIIENHKAMDTTEGLQIIKNKVFSIANIPKELITIQNIYVGEWTIKDQNKEKKLYLFNDIVIFAHPINNKKNKYKFEKCIDILNYDLFTKLENNKRFIHLIKKNETTPNLNNNIHSQYSIGSERYPQPTDRIVFSIENGNTNYFVQKYKEQKNILSNNDNNNK